MSQTIDSLSFRRQVLTSVGASEAESQELLSYNENTFRRARPPSFPLADELFVEDWRTYAAQCEQAGTILPLQHHLIELRFPIREGMSQTAEYIAATRRGIDPGETPCACALSVVAPDKFRLLIHPTAAGRIPILIATVREDFVMLVQALSKRNEPVQISDSMGACIIGGYNNWSRLHAYVRHLENEAPLPYKTDRRSAFQRAVSDKARYQDRFILLSSGPYSGVAAEQLGMNDDEWIRVSTIIRREHECAHYFTRRIFGSMRNAVLDELIADFAGITAALGTFRADWFLLFVGLEDFPRYRSRARLENYRGTPPLSDGAFSILQRLVRDAAWNLERFTHRHETIAATPECRSCLLAALSCFTVEELASAQGDEFLASELSDVIKTDPRSGCLAPDLKVPRNLKSRSLRIKSGKKET
jgi:hypothetical protein